MYRYCQMSFFLYLYKVVIHTCLNQVVEHGLGHLPFTEKQVITPTGESPSFQTDNIVLQIIL